MTQLLIGTKEASKLLGVSLRTVQDLCAGPNTGFPAVKMGNRYLINPELLAEWVKQKCVTGGDLV